MAGRNRGPPMHEPPFGRSLGPMPPHSFPPHLDEMRRGGVPLLPPPHHAAFIEERLAVQHQEIQGLLVDNQRLAATHVALKQELEAATHELQRMSHIAGSLRAENDVQMREVYEKSMKLEGELRGVEGMKNELGQVRMDVQKLGEVKQELTMRAEGLSQELSRFKSDMQKVPALKDEIETMRQELERARAAIDYERKAQAERYEHGQEMQNKIILIAREVEKLRAESEMRMRAAAVGGNPGAGYGGNYNNNPDPGYGVNPYNSGYGVNPVQQQGGAEVAPQYGPGPGPGAWNGYDMQRAPGHR